MASPVGLRSWSRSFGWRCCRRTPTTNGASLSRYARGPEGRRRGCSPPTCTGCTPGTPITRGGRWRCSTPIRRTWEGFNEIAFGVEGKNAFGRLKYERGVHRVQRIPTTESSGRLHTSTVTVAVLPEAEEVDIQDKHGRPSHRRLPRRRARGTEREQGGDGHPDRPQSHGDGSDLPGRTLPVQEQAAGVEHICGRVCTSRNS